MVDVKSTNTLRTGVELMANGSPLGGNRWERTKDEEYWDGRLDGALSTGWGLI